MVRALPVLLAGCLCAGFTWPGRLHRLEYDLEHGDAARRREVVRELASYPGAMIEQALLEALEDEDAEVRKEAAGTAGRVGLRTAVPLLRDWLDDRESAVRAAAALALADIGDDRTREPLVRALGDTAADVRRAAVYALARIGGEEAVPPLLARLDDADAGVRLAAAAALARLGDARAVVPLVGAARDDAPEVREAVMTALGTLGDARARPALEQALADRVEPVKLAAVSALGRVGGASAVRSLARAVRTPEARLASAALGALAETSDPAALAVLVEALDEERLRERATEALVRAARRAGVGEVAAGIDARSAANPVVTAVVAALDESRSVLRSDALATVLIELSAFTSIADAAPKLQARLDAAIAVPSVLRALGATGAPDALLPLLERLDAGDEAERAVVLDALELHFERAAPDGRAADPLLAALAAPAPVAPARIVRLLGRIGAERALPALRPLLASGEEDVQLAAIDAVARIGDVESAPVLVDLLGKRSTSVRFAAAEALHRCARPETVRGLLTKLGAPLSADPHAVLVALGGAAARLDPAALGKDGLDADLLAALAAELRGADRERADRALDALVVWRTSAAMDVVAGRLREPSSRARASGARALAAFPGKDTRAVLRYLLRHDASRVATAAAAALGEVGEGRDVEALARAAERLHWPVPAAAAYGIARMARRGELKEHATQRLLCELGRTREPYVRANVAAALAVWGAAPCEGDGPDPFEWLAGGRAAALRVAAAHWLAAAARSGRVDAAAAARALARCALSDTDARVRDVCASPRAPDGRESVAVDAYESDASTLLRDRLVALRLSDGSVYVGATDRNGHVRVDGAAPGGALLEDPGLVGLEPE